MSTATPSVRYFCCGSCDMTFPQGWQARDEHCRQSRHRHPEFECARCSLFFISQNEADLHMEAANHFPYICRFCEQSWPIEEQCEEHEVEEHLNAECTNEELAIGTSTDYKSPAEPATEAAAALEQLTLRSRTITKTTAAPSTAANGPAPGTSSRPPKKKLACSHCTRTFACPIVRDRHLKQSHRIHLTCRECNEIFETRADLRRHYRRASNHGVSCPYCKMRYTRASILSRHLEYGMCPKAQHLNYFGLYRYIRFKDPLEKLTIQLPGWDCIERVGNNRPFFYHCPNNGCGRKFRTFVGVISHLESRATKCQFKANYKEVQKVVTEKLLSGFKILYEI